MACASAVKPKIAIIGGGIAGVAAAEQLWKAGFHDLIILEALGRLGGRISTVYETGL